MPALLTRREMIRTSAGAMAGLAVGIRASAEVAARPPAATHPNILFLMVDEMRWDCLGCAGHPVVKTDRKSVV